MSDEPALENDISPDDDVHPPEGTESDPEIENEEGSPELTEEQVREIEEARDRIEEGNYITEEEASDSLGLDRN